MNLRRCLTLVCFVLFAATSWSASDDVAEVWKLAADHLGREAYMKLGAGNGPETRERKFAEAVLAIDFQPVTQDRLHDAERTFEDVARGDDEMAAAAAYLQARLHQIHYQQPDYIRAAQLYRALANRQPHSHWAQLGIVKLGLLTLYALPQPTTPAARISAARLLLPELEEKELVRDLHLQLGRAGAFYEQPIDSFLPHLLEADRIGGLVGQAQEDLTAMLGELSLRAGHYAQSRQYFERYLRDYTYNMRQVTVRRRLEDLAALEAKAASAAATATEGAK